MADEPFDDEGATGPASPRPQPEGVRIIGAQEAAGSVTRTEAVTPDPAELDPEAAFETTSTERSGPGVADPAAPRFADPAPTQEVSQLPPVEPQQSFEMPHYSDPPTGQVPKVVIGEETDSRWSGLADQPRWRDTEHHFDEQGGFESLADDGPRLGALGDTGQHRSFLADLDLTDDKVPTIAGPPSREERAINVVKTDESAEGEDDATRRPPGPKRRRASAAPDGPPRQRALGADSGGGGRSLPLALAVGVGLIAVAGGCFYLGATATMVFITVVLCLCAVELFTSLEQSGYRPAGLLGVVGVAGLSIAPLYHGYFAYPIVFGVATLTGLAWFLFVQPGEGSVMNLGVTLLGIAYVGGLGSFATLMVGVARPFDIGDNTTNQGIGVLIAAVLVTVSYDVGAYFLGKAFGHTPLSAASPNKTQEGLIGGVAVAIIVPFLILWLAKLDPVGVDWATVIKFVLICAVMAPVGDLCESAIKRDLGVKDMGTLLPGHGGVLDRFDAMLFVLPTAFFMAHLLNLGAPAFF